MRGFLRKSVFGILVLSFALSLYITAMAFSIDNPLCDFTIIAIDETGGKFTGRIDVTLTDISGGNGYNYVLTRQNYWGREPIKNVILANTTYAVKVLFSDFEGFALYNIQDDTPVEEFQATESEYVAQWSIRSTSSTKISELADDALTPQIYDYSDTGIVPQMYDYLDADIEPQLGGDYYDVKTGIAFFEEFYKSVRHMYGNPVYNNVFRIHGSAYQKVHASRYVRFASGTEAEWFSFSLFERFLWHETYLQVMTYFYNGNPDYFFNSENEYFEKVVNNTIRDLRNTGDSAAVDAYKELMRWQYHYIRKHFMAYNFMSHISNFDATNINYHSGDKTIFPEIEELLENDKEQLKPNVSVPVPVEKQKGIWDDVVESVKSSFFTLIILFIFASAWGGVMIYRKLNNIKVVEEK